MANSTFKKMKAIDPKHVIYSSLVLTDIEVTRAIKLISCVVESEQETMRGENRSPIHGPLPMIIFFNLILARGQTARLF